MAIELFGPPIATYATVACVVSFLITGHRSVYPSQVLSISKSPSLQVELGKEIEEIKTTLNFREKGFIGRTLWLIKRIEDTVSRIQQGTSFSDNSNNHNSKADKKQK